MPRRTGVAVSSVFESPPFARLGHASPMRIPRRGDHQCAHTAHLVIKSSQIARLPTSSATAYPKQVHHHDYHLYTPSRFPAFIDFTTTASSEVPEEFFCPLTLEIMKYPVMSRTGHSFERQAIFEWLQANTVCPLTRKPMSLSRLVTNAALQERIAAWCEEHDVDLNEGGASAQRNDFLPVHFALTPERVQKKRTPGLESAECAESSRDSTGGNPRFRVRLPFRGRHVRCQQ